MAKANVCDARKKGPNFGMRARVAGFALSLTLFGCGGDGAGPSPFQLHDAARMASRLESVDRAVAMPQLRSLSGLSIPINRGGIDVHNMTTDLLGRSLEWDGVYREVF